ncbi:MAG: hypothetical protein KF812_10010, partial [Fimbriimonadaceae bacterium]|nr:hypothetical protein [Fimbriimonadaceae bacterium]
MGEKKQLSTGRKIFNGVALLALIGGVLAFGAKYGGEFQQAQALGPLEAELVQSGLPTAQVVNSNLGEGVGMKPSIEGLVRLMQDDPNLNTQTILARWQPEKAVELMEQNAQFAGFVAKAAEAGRYETGIDYSASEFSTNSEDGAAYAMVEVSAHAAKAKILEGDYELGVRYGKMARHIANLMGKAPFASSIAPYVRAVETADRYMMEALDKKRDDPKVLAAVKEVMAVEIDPPTPGQAALYELYRVRLNARDMGRDAQKFHLTVSNWFGGESELEDADLFRELPGGPKAPELVEIQVLRQLKPLVDEIKANENNPVAISEAVERFRTTLPAEPTPGMDAVLPRIFNPNLEGLTALASVAHREELAKEVIRLMEQYQTAGSFPATFAVESPAGSSHRIDYSKTPDGFALISSSMNGG